MSKVKIYFQTITPESAERGVFAETGEHSELVDYTVDEIIQHIDNNYGFLEPSSSGGFHKGIWFTTVDPEIDYTTGEETYYTIHFDEYSEKQQQEIFNRLMGGK